MLTELSFMTSIRQKEKGTCFPEWETLKMTTFLEFALRVDIRRKKNNLHTYVYLPLCSVRPVYLAPKFPPPPILPHQSNPHSGAMLSQCLEHICYV